MSVIFLADFNNNVTALVEYLNYLTHNETAYERHRQWRLTYNHTTHFKQVPLLSDSWFCRVCQWAVQDAPKHHKRVRICPNMTDGQIVKAKAPKELEGLAVRGNARQVYLIKDGILRGIPDLGTFQSLQLDLEKIKVLSDREMEVLIIGEPLPRAS